MADLKTTGTKLRWAESNPKLPQMSTLVCFQPSVQFQCMLTIPNSSVPCVLSVWESLWGQLSIFLILLPNWTLMWVLDQVPMTMCDLGQFTQASRIFFFRVLSHVWKEGAEPEIHYDHFQFLMSIILQNEKGIKCAKKIFLCYFFSKIQNPKTCSVFQKYSAFFNPLSLLCRMISMNFREIERTNFQIIWSN